MTFPRKIGFLLLLAALLATLGEHFGWALPSLRWFYSFDADPDLLVDQPWRAMQGRWIGWAWCGVMAVTGVLLIARGGRFQWNPLTLRKLARFRSIGRGYGSFKLLVLLLVFAMLDQAVVGKRALAVKYEGRWLFPAFVERIHTAEEFGGEGRQEVDYRELRERLAEEGTGRVILPPVPWDPTFDSDDQLRRALVNIDGRIFEQGARDPYNGYAVRFREENPELRVRAARIRDGLPNGPGSVYDEEGEFAGRETWQAGEVVESSLDEGAGEAAAGPWTRVYFPPLPPSWERRHYLGTDSKGWDLAAQLFGGMQVVFKAAVLYIALTYGIGIVLGCLMGYFGGGFDLVMQRVMEIISNVPFLLVVMILTNNLGREKITLGTVILIFGIFSWITVATYLRTATYKEKARDYASAARVLGAGTGRIIFRHILPNAISTIVTLLPFSVAAVITSLTALDFLGFGVPDRYPSWGRLLSDGVSNLGSPWIVSSVFAMMVVLLLLITFIGEAVREAFDPKKFTTYE